MLNRGFNLLSKDYHLLIQEDVTFLLSCKGSSSAIALPYMEGILQERDRKGRGVGWGEGGGGWGRVVGGRGVRD